MRAKIAGETYRDKYAGPQKAGSDGIIGMLKAMWCSKDQRRIFLQSCISIDCKLRRTCHAYATMDAAAEADAMSDIQKHGHHAAVPPMPLLCTGAQR